MGSTNNYSQLDVIRDSQQRNCIRNLYLQDTCRTYHLRNPYKTIPRYYDEPKGKKKKKFICLGFFVVGFEVFFNEKVELSFQKDDKYNNNYKLADLLRQTH